MIDLAVWNLSIPTGSAPATIDTPALLKGYRSEYFHTDSGTLYFWAPVTGSHTEHSHYPRSELRETNADGSKHNWVYSDADNVLRATVAVTQVPASGRVVVGQIHVANGTKPFVKLEYEYKDDKQNGNIVAMVRLKPDDKRGVPITVLEDVPLNARFNYVIHLSQQGELSISANGANLVIPTSSAWRGKQLYFKAGVYTQDNTGASDQGGKAAFYALGVHHDKN